MQIRAIHIWIGEKITEYERIFGNIPYPEEVDSRIEGIMNNNTLLHFCCQSDEWLNLFSCSSLNFMLAISAGGLSSADMTSGGCNGFSSTVHPETVLPIQNNILYVNNIAWLKKQLNRWDTSSMMDEIGKGSLLIYPVYLCSDYRLPKEDLYL
jgi:hypothetical protein